MFLDDPLEDCDGTSAASILGLTGVRHAKTLLTVSTPFVSSTD